MYKIQVRSSDKIEWEDMIDMPEFHNEKQAQFWLRMHRVDTIGDIFQFRIVPIEPEFDQRAEDLANYSDIVIEGLTRWAR